MWMQGGLLQRQIFTMPWLNMRSASLMMASSPCSVLGCPCESWGGHEAGGIHVSFSWKCLEGFKGLLFGFARKTNTTRNARTAIIKADFADLFKNLVVRMHFTRTMAAGVQT